MKPGIELLLVRCRLHGKHAIVFSDRTSVCTGASIATGCPECVVLPLDVAWNEVDRWAIPPMEASALGAIFLTQSGATPEQMDQALNMVEGAENAMRRPFKRPQ